MDDEQKYQSKLLAPRSGVDAPDDRVVWEWAVRGLHGCMAIIEDLVIAGCPIDDQRLRRLVQALHRINMIVDELD
jgi:hypothetical protein